MYVYTRSPLWLKTKLDSLKIPVNLHKFQDTLEDLVEKLEHEIGVVVAQVAQLPDREIDNPRSWIPTMPSLNDCGRAVQRIRANFATQGFGSTLVNLLRDAFNLIGSSKFWQSKYGKALVRLTLTLGKLFFYPNQLPL